MNQKLILDTLANLTGRVADLQLALAGLTALVESRLPNLTPEQIEKLQSGIEIQKNDAARLKLEAEHLQQAVRNLN